MVALQCCSCGPVDAVLRLLGVVEAPFSSFSLLLVARSSLLKSVREGVLFIDGLLTAGYCFSLMGVLGVPRSSCSWHSVMVGLRERLELK